MRLIDADATAAMTATCPKGMDIDSFIAGMGVVLDRIAEAPTVDAVVLKGRCKYCRYWCADDLNEEVADCDFSWRECKANDFCYAFEPLVKCDECLLKKDGFCKKFSKTGYRCHDGVKMDGEKDDSQ